jgi:5-methylcytosine-specific restriction protein A
MNRKQFITSHGATCDNWTWSWSFVNHGERFVIFGAWDTRDDGTKALILDERWATSRRGRKQPAYAQSREHIRLVEEEGYRLLTFPMKEALSDENDETSPAKIAGFAPELVQRSLLRIGRGWYATSEGLPRLAEEVHPDETMLEGAIKRLTVNSYERNPDARRACLAIHGYLCSVCGFDFEDRYGPIGHRYIHVHHIVPISEVGEHYEVNPETDLVPICPNCHAMIHSTRPALNIEELQQHMQESGKKV